MQHSRDDGSPSLKDNLLAAAAGDREAQAAAYAEICRIHAAPPPRFTTLTRACRAQRLRDIGERLRREESS